MKVRQFFISLDSSYSDLWAKETSELHFINVPIRYNSAWVFPVGLSDAVWFAFKNPQLKVIIDSDAQTALNQVGFSEANKVFIFNDDGSLTQLFYQAPKNK